MTETKFKYRPVPKSDQLYNKRVKPTQRQMGDISNKVRQEVRERSKERCEVVVRCKGDRAYEMAHITGRRHIGHRTTAEDLLHACVECHRWLDQTAEGIKYKRKLRDGNVLRP